MGTAEIESALVAFDKIAEAAIVGVPHDIKGQAIYAYITLINGEVPTAELHKEVKDWVRKEIGPIATPGLPALDRCPAEDPARARSCAVSCAKSPPVIPVPWEIPRPWPIRVWSTS